MHTIRAIRIYCASPQETGRPDWLPMLETTYADGYTYRAPATHGANCTSEADALNIARRHASHLWRLADQWKPA